MAKALAPAYLRVGGTAADLLIFREKGSGRNGKFWRERQHNSSCEAFCPLGQIDLEKVQGTVGSDEKFQLWVQKIFFEISGPGPSYTSIGSSQDHIWSYFEHIR